MHENINEAVIFCVIEWMKWISSAHKMGLSIAKAWLSSAPADDLND